jgi:hypothetical protein
MTRFFEFNDTFNSCIDLKNINFICKDTNIRSDGKKERRIIIYYYRESQKNKIEYILENETLAKWFIINYRSRKLNRNR